MAEEAKHIHLFNRFREEFRRGFGVECEVIGPADAIKTQASKDGTKIVTSATDSTSAGASAAGQADTAIVFITADSGEGYITVEGNAGDRNNLDPWHNG